MAAVIGALRGLLSLDSAAFESGAKRSKASMGDLERRMVRMGSKIEGVGRKMTLGLTLPMAGLAAVAVKSSLQVIGSQAKMAQSLGTSVKSIQVLERAGELAGVSLEGIGTGLKDLTRRLSQASAMGGPVAKALDRIHLSANDLLKLPLDERVRLINQGLENFVPVAQRAAVAGQLFGEEGSLAFARIDSATLRTATEDVNRFGVAVSEVDADRIEAAQDAISRLGLVGRGVANQFTVGLAPTLQLVSDKAAQAGEWVANLSDRAKQMTAVSLSMAAALGPVTVALGLVLKLAMPIGRALLAIASPVGLVVAGLSAFVAVSTHFGGAMSDTVRFAQAHEIAMDNVTIAMGDQFRATVKLSDALRQGGPVTLSVIEAKMTEAKARRAVTDELVKERQERELEALGYYRILEAIGQYQTQLQNMRTPGDDLEQMPVKIRAAYEETERALASLLVQQQRLLEGVRSQNHLTDEERENLVQIQSNITELQRRWNELNGITADNVTLTDRSAIAAGALATGLGIATGQAAALKGFLSSLPGALAGANANIAGLRAGMAILSSGGDQAAANVAKFRAQLVASMPAMENMQDGQRKMLADSINQRVAVYKTEQSLAKAYQDQIAALNKAKSAGGSASKSALAQLLKEIYQRRKLIGLTEAQRKKLDAVHAVQQKLGKEAASLSKSQIEGLAAQVVGLDQAEDALKRVHDMQRQWSDQITQTMFEGGSLREVVTGMLHDIAYQFANSKIVLPIVGSLTSVLGLDRLFSGSVTQAVTGGTSGGGGLLGGLLGNAGSGLLGGSGILSGIGTGLGGVLSGGGLASSFANLGGLVTGVSSGLGAIGAALPAIGLIAGGLFALSKALSRKYSGTAIRGSMGADGFSGEQFDFYKGGALRSNKAYFKPLEKQLESTLDASMQGVTSGLTDMAGALGLGADAIKDFNGAEFTLWVHGKEAEQIQQELQEHIAAASDEMAAMVLGTDRFTRSGETASGTLSRLSHGLITVNDAADLLGHQAFKVSLRAADAASELVDLFGGADQMAAAANTYFGAFYSAGERTETIMRRLRERFEGLGVAMPESRAGFRELVEGIDLTTIAGRELYAQVLLLSGAMNEALPVASQFTAAMSGLLGEIGGEIGLQIDAVRQLGADAKANAALWYRTATTLRGFLGDLLNSDLTAASSAQVMAGQKARFDQAFDQAKAGDVGAAQEIPALARNYLRGLQETASSALEYRRAAAKVQGQIKFLGGIAELEGGNDDVLTGLYEQQIEVLTGLGNFLQLEGLTSEQVGQLSSGVQALAADWDGTVASFQSSLGALEAAISNSQAFSYDDLVGRLDVAVGLDDNAPGWVKKLVERAETGLRTTLDFIIRQDDLTAADRWIATNALSEHVATLDFVLRNDLDADTRRMALRTTGRLRRNMSLTLSQDLDGDTRAMVLTRSATLARRVNVALTDQSDNALSRLNRLQNLIGSEGNGRLTFGGGVQLTADTVFSELSSATSGLQTPMVKLYDGLGELRKAVHLDRLQRAADAKQTALNVKLSALNTKGAGAVERLGSQKTMAADAVETFNTLRSKFGIGLTGKNAGVNLRGNGSINAGFQSFSGTGANLIAFKKALKSEFGTKSIGAVFSRLNTGIGKSVDRAAQLRQQIIGLGEVPAFAAGGLHSGGMRLVGERGWEIEQTGSARIHSHADSVAMLDNRPLVSSVEALAKQVGLQGQRMEMVVRRISRFIEDWDEIGQPEVRA